MDPWFVLQAVSGAQPGVLVGWMALALSQAGSFRGPRIDRFKTKGESVEFFFFL